MDDRIKQVIQQAPQAVHTNGSLKLVIFDCDGVLVESEHIVAEIMGKEARQYGWNITDKQAREEFTGVQMVDIGKKIAKHAKMNLPDNWAEEAHKKVVEGMFGNVEKIPSVESILQTLHDLKIPYRVGSNSSQEEMKTKFEKTGLMKWFPKDRIHSAYEVRNSKPFPDLYLYAAEKERVNPDECLVIEDSDTGLKAAYDAGMACMLLRDLNKAAPNYKGVIRVDSLQKAIDIIKEIVQSQHNREH